MAFALLIKCEDFELSSMARLSHGIVKFVTAKLCALCLKFSVLSSNERIFKIGQYFTKL